jgi:hypothetical protein
MAALVEGRPPRQRPFGISLLAILAAISFIVGLWALFGGFGVADGGTIIAFAITVVGGLAAYGLWNLRPWAWPLALVTYVLATIDAVLLLTAGTINTNLVVGPLVIMYLFRSDIRELFRDQG